MAYTLHESRKGRSVTEDHAMDERENTALCDEELDCGVDLLLASVLGVCGFSLARKEERYYADWTLAVHSDHREARPWLTLWPA